MSDQIDKSYSKDNSLDIQRKFDTNYKNNRNISNRKSNPLTKCNQDNEELIKLPNFGSIFPYES